MSLQAITPYIYVNGKALEAIALYERAFGAKAETVSRFGDMPGSCPEAMRDRVMHAELTIEGLRLMLSDGPDDRAGGGEGPVTIALGFKGTAEASRSFDALAKEGGTVESPLVEAPWGAVFGMVRDRFGVLWNFNCEKSEN